MSYSWDFSVVYRFRELLLDGLVVTILISLISVVLGMLIGWLLALMRTSSHFLPLAISKLYIEVFRGLPVLVVLIWMYFCLPIFLGDGYRLSPFWVGAVALALNFSALHAEITRAGFEAIPQAELEAAKVLRFSRTAIVRHIVIPQTFWRSLSPTLGQAVNTIKLSSLVSFITVPDIFYQTSYLIQETYRPLELYSVLALLYLSIILPLSFGVNRVEQSLSERFRRN